MSVVPRSEFIKGYIVSLIADGEIILADGFTKNLEHISVLLARDAVAALLELGSPVAMGAVTKYVGKDGAELLWQALKAVLSKVKNVTVPRRTKPAAPGLEQLAKRR